MPAIFEEKSEVEKASRKLSPFRARVTSPPPSERGRKADSHQQSESLLDEIFDGYEDFLGWTSN